jgi:hypothetical protein
MSDGFLKILKSQISSTKLQINLKYQFPMTKTFTGVSGYQCTDLRSPILLESGPNADIPNGWNLFSGAWNFMIINRQLSGLYLANYLFYNLPSSTP